MPATSVGPVRLLFDYPERLSRLKLFVKWLFVWPLIIWLAVYGIFAGIVELFALVAILFTGRYPPGLFNFVRDYLTAQYRVWSYWPLYMSDKWSPLDPSPIRIEVDPPAKLSKLALIFFKLPAIFLGAIGMLSAFALLALLIVTLDRKSVV